MKQLTYRGIAYKKNDNNSLVKLVSGKVNHVYRGAVYHYENKNNEKTSV